MTDVIILNGPPFSGKDYVSEIFQNYMEVNVGTRCKVMRFKQKIYELLSCFYDVPLEKVIEICNDRELKEKPCDLFNGLTPRNACINMSENIVKPRFGKDYFGHSLLKRIPAELELAIISDGGFVDETMVLYNSEKIDKILVVRMKAEGCNFEGDSRSYLDERDFPDSDRFAFVDYFNKKEGSISDFIDLVFDILYSEKGRNPWR